VRENASTKGTKEREEALLDVAFPGGFVAVDVLAPDVHGLPGLAEAEDNAAGKERRNPGPEISRGALQGFLASNCPLLRGAAARRPRLRRSGTLGIHGQVDGNSQHGYADEWTHIQA
jgi:hypothetical protein